jgi:xanthosine utilization system XapX-like protein
LSILDKVTDFVGGGLFKEAKSLIQDYWPPEVSPDKRAEFDIKLKDIESQKEQQALSIARDEMAITVDDRKSARQALSISNMPQILSFLLTSFIAGIVYLLFFVGVPAESKEALLIILGIVIKEWGGSMQFWFGTTRSSQEKNKIIAQSEPLK